MAIKELEERVAILEQELLMLKRQLLQLAVVPWWEQISGVFADTPAFDKAETYGRRYRTRQQADKPDICSR